MLDRVVNPISLPEYWTPRSVFQDGSYLMLATLWNDRDHPLSTILSLVFSESGLHLPRKESCYPLTINAGLSGHVAGNNPSPYPSSNELGREWNVPSYCIWYGSPPAISGSFNSIFKVLFIFPSRYFDVLAVSCIYLALEGIYPLFRLHFQATLLIGKSSPSPTTTVWSTYGPFTLFGSRIPLDSMAVAMGFGPLTH